MGKLFALFTKKVSTANLETEGVDKVTSDVTKVIEDVVSSESVGLLSNLKEYFTLPFLFKILNSNNKKSYN